MIVKQGIYYRPDAKGYTGESSLAWKLPLDQAKRYEMYADRDDIAGCEKVTLREAPHPKYDTSLDAMAEAEATLTDEEHRLFRDALWHKIDIEVGTEIGTEQKQERAYQSRTAFQRLDAWLIAKGIATL
jgi:hypothetical protein